MELRFLGSDSDGGACPNVYETDRDTFVVQGTKITDPGALAALRARGLPDHETAVEIPRSLIKYFPDA
ncbi:hypothetical protein [Nonomuraea typhae]|uniref:DUF397 domain-containing protein n=1 Tax=Nonomuraea typhae TaxID=2603600 RepID=A0ABW7YM37_9ACTN